MAEQSYNFKKLEYFLNTEFLYATDLVEVLENVENTLINLELIMPLQPDISKASGYLEKLRLAINDAIPTDRRR